MNPKYPLPDGKTQAEICATQNTIDENSIEQLFSGEMKL